MKELKALLMNMIIIGAIYTLIGIIVFMFQFKNLQNNFNTNIIYETNNEHFKELGESMEQSNELWLLHDSELSQEEKEKQANENIDGNMSSYFAAMYLTSARISEDISCLYSVLIFACVGAFLGLLYYFIKKIASKISKK